MDRLSSCGLMILAIAAPAFSQVQPGTANTCEYLRDTIGVRMRVTKTVRPVYPPEAIRARVTGLVVAEICVPAGATVAAVRISSAPNDAIAQAVKRALSQWTFRTWFDEGADGKRVYHAHGGKIIFYFVEQNGDWKVLDPSDSFYVGPRFALKQQRPLSR